MEKTITIDLETTGLDYKKDKIVGFSVKLGSEPAGYYKPEDIEQFRTQLESPDWLKIAHNIKFEIRMLAAVGIHLAQPYYDTQIAIWLLNEGIPYYDGDIIKYRYGLKDVCNKLFEQSMPTFEEMLSQYDYTKEVGTLKNGKPRIRKIKATIHDVPVEKVAEYCINDVEYTYKLYTYTKEHLTARGMKKLFDKVEMPIVSVLVGMEEIGMNVDADKLHALEKNIDNRQIECLQRIESIARPFGIYDYESPKQLSELLFDKMDLPKTKKTKKLNYYSTGRKDLSKIDHPIIKAILERKKLIKIKSTFITPLIEKIDEGRIHTEFVQTGTVTGRFSCRLPNLQQVPVKTDEGKLVRGAFIAPHGYVLISADYSQVELRVLAHFSQDPKLLYAFRNGLDIHSQTASEIFGVPIEQVTDIQRDISKTVNFGLVYGSTEYGLSYNLGIPLHEARQYISKYFDKFKGVYRWQLAQKVSARQLGYAKTLFGRQRTIKGLNSGDYRDIASAEREAMNSPIQGTAADIIKIAMLKVSNALPPGSDIIMQVHDELLVKCFDDPRKVELCESIIKTNMESAVKLDVPLTVNISHGKNWGEL